MLPRTEYSVVVAVSTDLAFRAFSDLSRLLGRGIYEDVTWVEGKPWTVGSRIRSVVHKPLEGTTLTVITAYEPPSFVAMIHHAFGVTAEQQISFSRTHNGTNVRMMIEFVGSSPELPDELVRDAIVFHARDTLETMADLCRRWPPESPD